MAECETCHGRRFVRKWLSIMGGVLWSVSPCPACNGTGIQSCCEGKVGGPNEVTNTGRHAAQKAKDV